MTGLTLSQAGEQHTATGQGGRIGRAVRDGRHGLVLPERVEQGPIRAALLSANFMSQVTLRSTNWSKGREGITRSP